MKFTKLATALAFTAMAFGASSAIAVPTVSLHSSNSGISSMTYEVVGTTITITEGWGSSGIGALEISGLESGVDYTIKKIITNNSGVAWTRFANELLDPAGQANDDLDPKPYPSFVPVGFTTSNDNDGLSFAQGSGLPRTSATFAQVDVDELTDVRDFIDFSDGLLGIGATDDFMTFGLRDNADNQPFLLVQRPNQSSIEVPEPGTLALLGLGLFGLAYKRRKA